MKAASCFSGIGGAELALQEAEWLWCAEIEKFPSAVLAHRFGHPNLGDITAPDFIDRARAFGPLDLLCGGPPCQAFSIAGLRNGMSDPRGQLSIRFLEIAHAIRPRNLLVENVPGWLNHEDNAFGCFLAELVGADDALLPCERPMGRRGNDFWRWHDKRQELVPTWPSSGMVAGPWARAAWRVLDAQYAGLAQRRERVFLVADFGEGADPVEVLFERQGLSGNTPPRREAGEEFTGTISARAEGGGGLGTDFECDGGLQPVGFGGNNTGGPIDIATTLTSHGGPHGRLDFESETFIAHTLRPEGFDASEDGTGRGTPLVPVAFSCKDYGADAADNLAPTLRAMGHADSHANAGGQLAIATQWAVRRLTPKECERLQGYPDCHTMIEFGSRRTVEEDEAQYLLDQGAHVVQDNECRWRTNAAADGPRYKGIGNAWAVACVRPIAIRIKELQERIGA